MEKSAAVESREILDAIRRAPDGHLKIASDAGSSEIRRNIVEEGFLRRIYPLKPIADEELTLTLEHDDPVKVEWMEPDTKYAKSVPFEAQVDSNFYEGEKFACVFNVVQTPEQQKDINQLRTYVGSQGMDIKKVITDRSLKYIHQIEDESLIKTVERIIGPVGGAGVSGFTQNFEFEGGITRDTYPEVISILEDFRLNNGVFLMNRRTAKAFLKFTRNELGGDLAEKMFRHGLSALENSEIFGVRHIFTIKRDLVPDGVIYCFAEPEYSGRFYSLQDITMYVEKKKHRLTFSASEVISLTIANAASVAKVTFI